MVVIYGTVSSWLDDSCHVLVVGLTSKTNRFTEDSKLSFSDETDSRKAQYDGQKMYVR